MPLSFRSSTALRVTGPLLVAALIAAGSVGCGEAAPTGSRPASGTPTARAAEPVATAGPAASTPAKLRVRALPESVLTPIHGLRYRKIKGAPAVFPEIAAKAEFWEGVITRQVKSGPVPAGTVQLMRLRPGVITDDAMRDEVLLGVLTDFAQTKKFNTVQIGGQKVLTTTDVRDIGGSVAGWLDDRDLVVIYAVKRLSAEKIAFTYLTGKKTVGRTGKQSVAVFG